MSRILVLFVHPGQRHSRVNVAMARTASSMSGVTFVDLYAQYPTFNIDIDAEQRRLLAHDVIVAQFPLYWYSTPSLLKEWQDLVLEYGFAYGPGGDKLRGKKFLPVITAGGHRRAYDTTIHPMHGLRTLLSPLERTVGVCGMTFIPPFVLFGSIDADSDGRALLHIQAYRKLLEALRDDRLDIEGALRTEFLGCQPMPMENEIK